MAEGIVYLDVDDEITSAAQRIRSAAGTRVALVVPYGSRIATSRMNFRLLSREAVMNNRRLSIVSGDAAARSLAASAGLPVFGSVSEYDSSLAAPADAVGEGRSAGSGDGDRDGRAAARPASASAVAPTAAAAAATAATAGAGIVAAGQDLAGLAASETVVTPAPAVDPVPSGRKSQRPKRPVDDDRTLVAGLGAAAGAGASAAGASTVTPGSGSATARPVAGANLSGGTSASSAAAGPVAADPTTHLPPILGGRIRAPAIAAIGLIALALIVAGVGAYLFLPSASIALTPRREPIAPFQITVSADPNATEVDPVGGRVPAIRLDVPVQATRTFTTTGTHVEETAARGSVTFTNYDTSSGVSIPSGSIVSTEGGVRFRTQQTVVLQPAEVIPPSVAPTTGSVAVAATKAGEQGNVPANTIRVVPAGQDPVLLRVNNPNEASGGTHTETPEITKPEVDKAMVGLQGELQVAFSDAVAAGAGAPPDTTLFPETADLGIVTPSVDPKTLVGQPLASFDLALSASGTVIAVDPRPVETIARAELQKHLVADHRLIEDSVVVDVGDGTVGEDRQVTFQATVRATQVRIVDASGLRGLVKGKTKAEAEAALATFGTATVTLWPDWVTTVTTVDGRLDITVDDPTGGGGSGGSPSPAASPPRPSSAAPRSGAPASLRPTGSVAPSAAP